MWFHAADQVRLRAGVWAQGSKGTVILLPGRTEYVEKYGRAARDLEQRGFATLTIDWRGQGLADRALADPMTGHVQDFVQFQRDLDALMALADQLGLPEPRYLMAHSMGGCIGLRGLIRGVKVQAAVFSAPMWGISMAAAMRPVATLLSTLSVWTRQNHRYAPGTGPKTYVAEAPFEGNVLTSDPDMFAYMRNQVTTRPELSLGGPSLGWLHAALTECHALSLLPAPAIPAICALGTNERVVDPAPVHLRMQNWRGGTLTMYPGCEHEVLMETPAARQRFYDAAADLYAANG